MSLISWMRTTTPPILYRILRHPDAYLRRVHGVVHVGANSGQERTRYRRFGLRVLWVEPIPWIFEELSRNIAGLDRQSAVEALVTDVDGIEYQFHVANNDGQSSSLMQPRGHQQMWPEVGFDQVITLTSMTLPRLLVTQGYDISDFQALVLDTQGSELLVLEGASTILREFAFVKAEVADFEAYAGCCQVADLDGFMTRHGFRERSRTVHATSEGVGTYFDVLYERIGR